VLARLYRMPLRWVETRVEHMLATTHGRAQVADLEAAVEDDGTITALRMRVTANIGAYAVFTFIPDLTLMMGVGVYKIPNIDLQSTLFSPTRRPCRLRGAGPPEAAYYLEPPHGHRGAGAREGRPRKFARKTSSRERVPLQAPPPELRSGEYDRA